MMRLLIAALLFTAFAASASAGAPKQLRIGIIGCDTSHAGVFTSTFNNPKLDASSEPFLAGLKVVAAFPGGSPDLPISRNRVDNFTAQLRDKQGVEIVTSIEDLLAKVDVVLLLSVDGRVHWQQVQPVFKSGKRVFIDKPLSASLADALRIVEMSKQTKTPFFSSSSYRFGKKVDEIKASAKENPILGCITYGSATLAEHHPEMAFYGVHGFEYIYAFMGPGCKTVTRSAAKDHDVVTGTWTDGRMATFRGTRSGAGNAGATVFTKNAVVSATPDGYTPMLREVGKFFRGGAAPVSVEEMLEVIAVIEAADLSKVRDGAPVALADVFKAAKAK